MPRTAPSLLTAFALAAALAAGTVDAQPRYGSDHAVRFRAGLFSPDGDSTYWEDKELFFTGEAEDFEDVVAGVDFRYGLGPRSAILISGDVYSGEEDQAYLDFVDDRNRDIFHTTTLDVASVTAAYTLNLTGPRSPVVPYVGVGGGFYFWSLEERGDFIDFGVDPPEIFFDVFDDDGATLGWYWMAGIEIPVGPRWGFFAEGRWVHAEDELSDDFDELGDLDLGGRQIVGGASWRF